MPKFQKLSGFISIPFVPYGSLTIPRRTPIKIVFGEPFVYEAKDADFWEHELTEEKLPLPTRSIVTIEGLLIEIKPVWLSSS